MILDSLQSDLNTSLKAGKSVRVATLRLLMSAVRNAAIAKYGNTWETSLAEADLADVVKKQIKTHKESIDAFKNAGRQELVDKEAGELAVLEEFAPRQISDDDLKALLVPVVSGAGSEKNFGLLMKSAMQAVGGKADGGRVSALLKQMLQ